MMKLNSLASRSPSWPSSICWFWQ